MKRVAEIIHIVEGEREAFMKGALSPDEETQKVLWKCGVRRQQYFALNELIFMTFEYKGHNFDKDMKIMAAYLCEKGLLVEKRRKDVPFDERDTTNWWAPVKKLGIPLLLSKPASLCDEEDNVEDLSWYDGNTKYSEWKNDISYDEDDWSESMHM